MLEICPKQRGEERRMNEYFAGFSSATASRKSQAEGRKGIETKYQLHNRVKICVRWNKDIA